MSRIKKFFKNFWDVINRPEMTILPGQLAFFFVLSVVPIVSLIAYGASALNLSFDLVFEFLSDVFSQEIANMLTPAISGGTTITIQFLISIIVAYFIASNGAASIIVTSNSIYKIKNSNYIKRRIKAMIMTLLIVILFVFILVVPVFGDKIIELVQYMDISVRVTDTVTAVFNILKGPVSWFIIFLFIKILYTMSPDRKLKSSRVNYGAIFTSIFWIITTTIYSYYISHFARYDIFYGGFANIVILMLWVYFLAYIFVIGMALNHKEEVELEKTGQINLLEIEKNKK